MTSSPLTLRTAAILCLLAALTSLPSCRRCGRPYPETTVHESWSTPARHTSDHRTSAPATPTHPEADRQAASDIAEPSTRPEHEAAAQYELAMPAPRTDIAEQILRRKAYVTSFNRETLIPNWVAWCLTREHTRGKAKRTDAQFHEDPEVDPRYRVTTYDYQRSGFDRGHMCPAGDNKWDAQAMDECFLMTNICPQLHSLNAGDWNEIEMRCRTWANRYGRVYIVSGPIILKEGRRRIGRQHKVTVPQAFFKVVLRTGPDGHHAIGFIYRNRDGNRPMGDYVNSVDEVERITGYDLFAQLPDNIERQVEAHADLSEW